MKTTFVFILLTPFFVYGQSKTDLQLTIGEKNQKIESLKEEVNQLKMDYEISQDSLQNEVEKRKSILRSIIQIWLQTPFENKYNAEYFKNTEYSKLDIGAKERMDNSQVMVNSILLSENPSSNIYKLADKVNDYNSNYYLLDDITTQVFKQKYNKEKVDDAIIALSEAPNLATSTKLQSYKMKLISLLKNYGKENCKLTRNMRMYFEAFSAQGENPYDESELIKRFEINEEYPVLVQARDSFIADYNFYEKEENRLPDSCSEIEKTTEDQNDEETIPENIDSEESLEMELESERIEETEADLNQEPDN